jgi:hypothetical protein
MQLVRKAQFREGRNLLILLNRRLGSNYQRRDVGSEIPTRCAGKAPSVIPRLPSVLQTFDKLCTGR